MGKNLTELVVREFLCGSTSLRVRVRHFWICLLGNRSLYRRAVDYLANVIGIIWIIVVLIATAAVAAIPIVDDRGVPGGMTLPGVAEVMLVMAPPFHLH